MPSSHSHHHHKHKHGGYYANDETFFYVLICLVSVIPLIMLLMKIRQKIAGHCKPQTEQRECRSCRVRRTSLGCDTASIFTITKQDYMNLPPPRYSVISMNPLPITYENPPPYPDTNR